MAWRIQDSVKRGEIDNRERGVVRGKIWLEGVAEPVALQLQGNACPDLAGCLLAFENPGETIPLRTDGHMYPLQHGTIGDLTASRKVRVFDLPFDETCAMLKRKEKPPEHLANSLYLEWFSEENGRVVIESTDYKLTLSPPAWRLTSEEEHDRAREAAEGFAGFMDQLSAAVEAERHEPPEEKEWDEFDYEKFLRESDARTDKYMELLDKYMDHPDRDRIIAEEMGWAEGEEAEGEPVADDGHEDDPFAHEADAEKSAFDTDEINRICAEALENPTQPDPTTEGVDWVRDEEGEPVHPVYLRAFKGAMGLWHKCDELNLDKGEDADLCNLTAEYQITSAKLAGALNGLAEGRDLADPPFTVAYLKRALNHLHAAQAALERVAPKHLLPAEMISSVRTDLFRLREEIIRLMDEFRGRK